MKSIFGIFLIALSLNSCMIGVSGNENVSEESRKITAVNRIDASGMFQLTLIQGEPSLKIIADENLLELIETNIKGDRLIISSKKNIRQAKHLEIVISSPEFKRLQLSGAVSIHSKETLRGDGLRLETSGAAEVDLALDYDELRCELSGASEIKLRGVARSVRVSSSGATDLRLFELDVRNMRLNLSGASEARINVSKELSVEASGASEIRYKGNPKITKTELSGASSINPENN
jgi:hypothetical protein